MKHLEILILGYVKANMPTVLHQYALALVSTGHCAAAMVSLNRAITRGHLPSRALKTHMMIDGREGVAKDCNAAFELVEEGARLGCHHCQGVMAECYRYGYGIQRDEARSLELARESSGLGSRYGQYALGLFYRYGGGGVAEDLAQALALYRLAAAQNFGVAQFSLGSMYYLGRGVAEDVAEALRLFQLAAAQGYSNALFWVAFCYECGRGIPKNKAEAIYWYRRALAAGFWGAAAELRRLCA
jgi:TPR repeat protein